MTTPTPRTDEVERKHGLAWFGLHDELGRYQDAAARFREIARQLERDLAAAQEARQADEDRLWSAIGGREAHWIEHHDEDGTLRRDQLTLEGALIFLHGASERAQRAEALAEKINQILLPDPHDEREVSAEWQVKAIRAAIDAARKP